MYIIIDGCNVLRSGKDPRPVNEHRKRDFMAQLAEYARYKKHEITVVFDGGVSARPEYYVQAGVTIWHSGYDYSADDVVKQLITEANYPFETLVVSSDRELNDCAEDHNIASIDSALFKKFLKQALRGRANQAVRKGSGCLTVYGSHSAELDALMMSAAQDVFDKDMSSAKPVSAASRYEVAGTGKSILKKGKVERRLQRILEKL